MRAGKGFGEEFYEQGFPRLFNRLYTGLSTVRLATGLHKAGIVGAYITVFRNFARRIGKVQVSAKAKAFAERCLSYVNKGMK